ncbi:hypothetical protein AB0K49_13575 [Streptomyces decoyicus]|uniref:hypothetical protein n=1 Tax=Streptomyces decoyicus TaxID=249567 RepID=UPI00345DE200
MFEIRVICDNTDIGPVTKGLVEAFKLSDVRRRYTSDGKRLRLYATANPRTTETAWPSPEKAYASAPSILDEVEWINRAAAETGWDEELDREYYLRKAAAFDRIALANAADGHPGDTTGEDVAAATAVFLLDYDRAGRELYGGTPHPPGHPASEADPRGYVRQEYALWSVCTCDAPSEPPCLKHPSA